MQEIKYGSSKVVVSKTGKENGPSAEVNQKDCYTSWSIAFRVRTQ
jgi:hypothetical protein